MDRLLVLKPCSALIMVLVLVSCLWQTSVQIAHGSNNYITATRWQGSGIILSGGSDVLKITTRNPEDYSLDLYIKFSWSPNSAPISVASAAHHFGPNEVYEYSVPVSNSGTASRITGTLSVTFTDWVGLLTAGSAQIPFTLSTSAQPTTLSVQVTDGNGNPLNKLVTAKWNSGAGSESKWSGTSGTAVFGLGSGYAYQGNVEVTVEQTTRNVYVTEGANTETIALSSLSPSPPADQPSSSPPPYLIYIVLAIISIIVVLIGGLVLRRRSTNKGTAKPADTPPPPVSQ